jgi:hypothetical protein
LLDRRSSEAAKEEEVDAINTEQENQTNRTKKTMARWAGDRCATSLTRRQLLATSSSATNSASALLEFLFRDRLALEHFFFFVDGQFAKMNKNISHASMLDIIFIEE